MGAACSSTKKGGASTGVAAGEAGQQQQAHTDASASPDRAAAVGVKQQASSSSSPGGVASAPRDVDSRMMARGTRIGVASSPSSTSVAMERAGIGGTAGTATSDSSAGHLPHAQGHSLTPQPSSASAFLWSSPAYTGETPTPLSAPPAHSGTLSSSAPRRSTYLGAPGAFMPDVSAILSDSAPLQTRTLRPARRSSTSQPMGPPTRTSLTSTHDSAVSVAVPASPMSSVRPSLAALSVPTMHIPSPAISPSSAPPTAATVAGSSTFFPFPGRLGASRAHRNTLPAGGGSLLPPSNGNLSSPLHRGSGGALTSAQWPLSPTRIHRAASIEGHSLAGAAAASSGDPAAPSTPHLTTLTSPKAGLSPEKLLRRSVGHGGPSVSPTSTPLGAREESMSSLGELALPPPAVGASPVSPARIAQYSFAGPASNAGGSGGGSAPVNNCRASRKYSSVNLAASLERATAAASPTLSMGSLGSRGSSNASSSPFISSSSPHQARSFVASYPSASLSNNGGGSSASTSNRVTLRSSGEGSSTWLRDGVISEEHGGVIVLPPGDLLDRTPSLPRTVSSSMPSVRENHDASANDAVTTLPGTATERYRPQDGDIQQQQQDAAVPHTPQLVRAHA